MNNNITTFMQRATHAACEDTALVVTLHAEDETWSASIVGADRVTVVTAEDDWSIEMTSTGSSAFDAITALNRLCATDNALAEEG